MTAKPQTVLLAAQQQSLGRNAAQQKTLSAGRTPPLQPGNTDQPAPDMDMDMASPDEAARAKTRLEAMAIQEIEYFKSSVLAHLPSNARSLCPHDHTPPPPWKSSGCHASGAMSPSQWL